MAVRCSDVIGSGQLNLPEETALNCSTMTVNASVEVETVYPAEYYEPIYRVVGSLLVGVIFVVGLVGNALVVAVVTRTRSMHTPTNWYLVSLALADIILLVSAPLPTLVEYHLLVDEWVLGRVGCSAMVFMQYLGVNVSSLSITAFTVERYIAICHPMRAQATNSVPRARRIILCLWSAGIIYCSPWLALSTTQPKKLDDGRSISTCTFTLPRGQYLIYYIADLVIFYAVPLLTATVLYGLIARTLYMAAGGPTRVGSLRSAGDSISVGGGLSRRMRYRVSAMRYNGVGGARQRRSTFARQQSSISMSSTSASNSRIQV